MRASTKNKIAAIIGLAISLTILHYNDWRIANIIDNGLLYTIAYIHIMIVTGIYFAYGFLYRYDFLRFKKWLIPAALVAYITPALVSICVPQDIQYLTTVGFYLAALLIGARVLAWKQGLREKIITRKDETKESI